MELLKLSTRSVTVLYIKHTQILPQNYCTNRSISPPRPPNFIKKKLIQRQRKAAIFQKIVISRKNCTCCKTVLCDCIVFGQNCKFQDRYQKEIPRIDSISHLDKELQHYIIEQDKKIPCDFFYD